jgi:hypothetical protein
MSFLTLRWDKTALYVIHITIALNTAGSVLFLIVPAISGFE